MHPVAAPTDHKFVITECALYVRRVKPSPETLLTDASELESNPALYPLSKSDIKLYTIPANVMSKEINGVTTGGLPTRVTIGLVLNEGLTGSLKHNPYAFMHYNVRSISLTAGGRQYPSKLMNLDYGNKIYMRAYAMLYEGLSTYYGDSGIGIPFEDFPNGYCLYVFDMTVSQSSNCADIIENVRETDLNIQIIFDQAPSSALSCVVYTETPALMEINKDRNVYVDYTN